MSKKVKTIIINMIASVIVIAALIIFKSVLWIVGTLAVVFFFQNLLREYWINKGDKKMKPIIINTMSSAIILFSVIFQSVLWFIVALILAFGFHHLMNKYWKDR